MKNALLLVSLFTLIACGGEEEYTTGPDNQEGLDNTTATESPVGEENLEDFPEQLPEGYTELIEKFDSGDDELDETYLQLLGADPEDAILMPFYTTTYHKMDQGCVFEYWTPSGATDLYQFETIGFSYFNNFGELINALKVNVISEDVEITIIQKNFVHVVSTYPEFIEGEFTFEETGKTETDHHYLVIDEELKGIEDVEKDMLPYYRNQLFAYHGYKFKSQKYTDYFSKFHWYKPQFDNVDDKLSEEEKGFADYIIALEEK